MNVIFWDWNGTLVNDAPVLCDVFNRVIKTRGVEPVSFERYREVYRHPVREMYEEVGVDLQLHSFDDIAYEWHEVYQAHVSSVQLHGDALATLESFRARNIRQMVLSALPQALLQDSVNLMGISSYFEHITGVSSAHGHSKVAEGVALLKTIGTAGSDVTIIGDSSHDAEVAKELSSNCILVARGAESRARLEAHGYPVVDSFTSLIDEQADLLKY